MTPQKSKGDIDAAEQPASGLIDHIQGVMEHQKALLARELHDELGGLLVGAVMDLAWAEQHLSAPPAELRLKLTRARQTLSAAIDMKRKLIEDLRPTLLDNVGLFAALRWHVQAASARAGFVCDISVPVEERRFLPNVPIALFRIVQEALAVVVARNRVARANFRIAIDRGDLSIELHSEAATYGVDDSVSGTESHYLAAIQQRVASLGGQFQSSPPATSSPSSTARTHIVAHFPLDNVIIAD